MADIPQRPSPPSARYICDACGVLSATGEHKGWLCRLFKWIENKGNKMNKATFFVGPSIDKTPAVSKKTLFVSGTPDVGLVEKVAREHRAPHIHLEGDVAHGAYWDGALTVLLDHGFWVTFEYPAYLHASMRTILNPGIWQSRLFVPVLVTQIPELEMSNTNLSVKLNDVAVGSWTQHFSEMTDSNRFTGKNEYERVEVLVNQDAASAPVSVPEVVKVVEVTEVAEAAPERKVFHVEVGDITQEETAQLVTEFLNQPEVGLDVAPTTALTEPAVDAPVDTPVIDPTITVSDAAAAYAEGTTTDPLSAENSKKPKAKK